MTPAPPTGSATDAPGPVPVNERAAAIARHVVRVTATHTGRGPTAARTTLGPDLVTVVLGDTLTKGERRLVEAGQSGSVLEMRRGFQATMRSELIAGVEQITGRTVKACLADHHIDPDIAVEVFVLVPAERPGRTPPG